MSKIAWLILIGVIALTLALGGVGLIAPSQGYGVSSWGLMRGARMMGGFGFPFMGGIVMLLFWVVVIGGGVWLVLAATRAGGRPAPAAPVGESSLDILKRRYAAGEIAKEQFDEMKRHLEQ